MSSIERQMIFQAQPHMLAEKVQAFVRHEACKGCLPDISPVPVALEPVFEPIAIPMNLLENRRQSHAIEEPPVEPDALIRFQVWISPEQKFDWRRGELFLRELVTMSHRAGFEIVGNTQKIVLTIFCHKADWPIVSAAFHGEFEECEIVRLESQEDPLARLAPETWRDIAMYDYYPTPPYSHLLTRPDELHFSPYESLITSLAGIPPYALGICQVLFQPVSPSHDLNRNVQFLVDLEYKLKLNSGVQLPQRFAQQSPSGDLRQMSLQAEHKAHNDKPFYATALRVAAVGAANGNDDLLRSLAVFASLFQHGGRPLNYLTSTDYAPYLTERQIQEMFVRGLAYRPGFLLNSSELTGLVHVPSTSIIERRSIPLKLLEPLLPRADGNDLSSGTPIGTCDVAGQARKICIPPWLRECHTHLIGRPRMGKSSAMERMILDDIAKGAGVAVIDPHGDLVERLLCIMPEEAVERSIYFDPGDPDWVPLWNPLQPISGQDLGRTADNLVGAFRSFITGYGDRLEHLLRNAFFGLMHLPESTLLDVSNLLRNKSPKSEKLCRQILEVMDNETAIEHLKEDFKNYRKDDLGPPKNKLSKLLLAGTASLMFSQPDSSFSFREMMDSGKVFLANLSSIGTEVCQYLGCLILSLIHLAAISRSEMPSEQRKQFHVYCDEAHRFMTDALEEILAEDRAYGVSLTLAHQYMSQFGSQSKKDALSIAGSTVIFNIDKTDASHLVKDLQNKVDAVDLITLKHREAILRTGTEIVRIKTLERPEIAPKNFRDQIIAESRRRYYKPAHEVRQAIRNRHRRPEHAYTPLTPAPASKDPDGRPEEFIYDEF